MVSFPLKTHIFPIPFIQSRTLKCFPCTGSVKFCMLGQHRRISSVVWVGIQAAKYVSYWQLVINVQNISLYICIYNFNLFVIQWQQRKKTKTDNKQETETRLSHRYLAQPKTELHRELSISMNFVKIFCLRHTIKLDTDWLLNMTRHSFTMSVDDVLNNYINRCVCLKSNDRLSATLSGQASSPYSKIGTHFVDIKCNIVSSLAIRKTLLK